MQARKYDAYFFFKYKIWCLLFFLNINFASNFLQEIGIPSISFCFREVFSAQRNFPFNSNDQVPRQYVKFLYIFLINTKRFYFILCWCIFIIVEKLDSFFLFDFFFLINNVWLQSCSFILCYCEGSSNIIQKLFIYWISWIIG